MASSPASCSDANRLAKVLKPFANLLRDVGRLQCPLLHEELLLDLVAKLGVGGDSQHRSRKIAWRGGFHGDAIGAKFALPAELAERKLKQGSEAMHEIKDWPRDAGFVKRLEIIAVAHQQRRDFLGVQRVFAAEMGHFMGQDGIGLGAIHLLEQREADVKRSATKSFPVDDHRVFGHEEVVVDSGNDLVGRRRADFGANGVELIPQRQRGGFVDDFPFDDRALCRSA